MRGVYDTSHTDSSRLIAGTHHHHRGPIVGLLAIHLVASVNLRTLLSVHHQQLAYIELERL